MRTDEFTFDLPEKLIALRPVAPRDRARLLVVEGDRYLRHRSIVDLPDLLAPGDVLVANDTRVIPARLRGWRHARQGVGPGAKIEVLLHSRTGPSRFRAFARPAKRLRPGDRLTLGRTLQADIASWAESGDVEIAFDREAADLDAAITVEGEMPLPPYIASRRAADARDAADYQTLYARISGSVAAPTAGLHFTPDLLRALEGRRIGWETLTLHVGPGTFLPISTKWLANHKMHAEYAELSPATAEALNAARARGGRIVAVGTTALRTLETAADENGIFHPFQGKTSLFITPGYRFKAVDVLLTNFHLPRSTLFMLVCAFSSTETMKVAYAEAVARKYRFYSYGDACLLLRPGQ